MRNAAVEELLQGSELSRPLDEPANSAPADEVPTPSASELADRFPPATRVPSGDNAQYLLQLAAFLESVGERDEHVERLAELVRRSQQGGAQSSIN